MSSERNPLVRQALSGDNRELSRLAAGGLLPLVVEDLIPLQVHFALGDDAELATTARDALAGLSPSQVADFVTHQAGEPELVYFGRFGHTSTIIESVLRRRDVPRALLMQMAGGLSAELQEMLLLRQDAIVEEPAILDALEGNPQLSNYARRRIGEYREHLLPRTGSPRRWEEDGEEASDEDVRIAIESVRRTAARGEMDEQTGLSDGQIRMLPVPVRLRLARTASRSLRNILVRDANPQVAVSVLRGAALSDQELEQIAGSRSVIQEVFDEIARRRDWVSKYAIASALVHNPRTPVAIAMRLLPRLSVRELRNLSRDRNVPDIVRSTAVRLYRIKQT